jgi:hypothetical protein
MTATTNNNGQRKTLAEQIDRLDAILDGLADNLNEAVSQSVRDGVRAEVQQAVRSVLAEALGSPELLALVCTAVAASQRQARPEKPGPAPLLAKLRGWSGSCVSRARQVWAGFWGRCRQLGQAAGQRVRQTSDAWVGQARQALAKASWAGRQTGRLLWRLRTPLLAATNAGLLLGLLAGFGGPVVAGLIGGLAGFTLTLWLTLARRRAGPTPAAPAWSSAAKSRARSRSEPGRWAGTVNLCG